MSTRPVWAEIALDRLVANFRLLRQTAAGAGLLAVVKANAYGHGVELCGPSLAAAGAAWLGVTSVEEGVTLRRALPEDLPATRILVMSSLWQGEADAVLDHGLTVQAWEPYQLAWLAEAAVRRGLAAGSVPVHLEIDTGMARQGGAPGPALGALLAAHFSSGSPLLLEGVMTHFSAPEVLDAPDTGEQTARFIQALEQVHSAGLRPRLLHAGNSTSVFELQQRAAVVALAQRFGAEPMLRPGLALYGYPVRFTPSESEPGALAGLEPVLAWKTRINSLRTLAPGAGAGYNSTFRAARPTRLALTPVGYADGLNRLLSNCGAMLVRGQRAPIAGRVSMDQTILDVTDILGAAIGDEVVILGEQAGGEQTGGEQTGSDPAGRDQVPSPVRESITAWEHADLCGTIPYEVLCSIAARVPRRVVD